MSDPRSAAVRETSGAARAALLAPALAAALSLVAVPAAWGQAFRALGFLDPFGDEPYSLAHGISGDGSTVVGESDFEAFRWRTTAPSFLLPLGFLPGGTTSAARAASADGTFVAGEAGNAASARRAFRWDAIGAMASLGTLAGDEGASAAEGISDDGLAVAGGSNAPLSPGRGFHWLDGVGMTLLDALPFPGKDASAYGLSGDGEVAVGRAGCCETSGAVAAARWAADNGFVPENLGDLPGTDPEFPWSTAVGISADGLTIVGGATGGAFRWEDGVMSPLSPPVLSSLAVAMDVSADGAVVVGTAADGPGSEVVSTPYGPVFSAQAFVWTAPEGMRNLQDVLVGLGLGPFLAGWQLEIATAVSDDGNVIAGYGTHDGRREAFVAALAGAPFESGSPPPPPEGGANVGYFAAFARESHGFLWRPGKGPVPIDPDPPPFVLGPAAELGARFVESALGPSGPAGQEQVHAILAGTITGRGAELRLVRFDGRSWSADWRVAAPPGALSGRGFDIAYEDRSGEALAVYATAGSGLAYRTLAGGEWSGERALEAPARTRAAGLRGHRPPARWVELVSRPGTDEIALAYLDRAGTLRVRRWDGSRFTALRAAVLARGLGAPGARRTGAARPFDVAYEPATGALLAAWSAAPRPGFRWARRDPARGRWSRVRHTPARGLRVRYVDLAAQPGGSRVAAMLAGEPTWRFGPGRAAVVPSMWASGRWRVSPRTLLPPRGHRHGRGLDPAAPLPGAVAWLGDGPTAVLVSAAGAPPGAMAWAWWTPRHGWTRGRPLSLPGGEGAVSVRLAGATDGPLLAGLSTRGGRVHLLALETGGGWRAVGDAALDGRSPAPGAVPFDLPGRREPALLVVDPGPVLAGHRRHGRERPRARAAFTVLPQGTARQRIDGIAFELRAPGGVPRDALVGARLVVDENANGRVDRGETATFGGPGRIDPRGRLVFLGGAQITAPLALVLRAVDPPGGPVRGLAISLPGRGVLTPAGPARGGVTAGPPGRRDRWPARR